MASIIGGCLAQVRFETQLASIGEMNWQETDSSFDIDINHLHESDSDASKISTVIIVKKWPNPCFFFSIFVFSTQLTVNVQYNFCQWLDSNHRPLELEVTTLPTEPLPQSQLFT